MNFATTIIKDKLLNFAILKISVNPKNADLQAAYKTHIENHNNSILTDPFPNAGFDLFVPEKTEVHHASSKSSMISMDVKCDMIDKDGRSTGYFMFPRSSIAKTPLMLANHTGIIDSGYRGNLIGAFRNLDSSSPVYTVDAYSRLLQICHPALHPIHVIMVEENELSTTSRGSGGFGSTGV